MTLSVAGKIPFYDLAELLEKLKTTKDIKLRKLLFLKFIYAWRTYFKFLHKNDLKSTDDSFYPILRLIIPDYERERVAYGVKELTLAHLYIKALSLGPKSMDAQKLMHYREHIKDSNDFADIAYEVLKNRCAEHGSLSIEEVNGILDNIAINKATKNKDLVIKNILYLVRHLSALEQKWVIRIILRQGNIVSLNHSTLLTLIHPDAIALFNVSNDLEKICLKLRDPETRLHEINIELFTPFKPMLAERSSHISIFGLLRESFSQKVDGGFIVETKFDGERMQIHYDSKEGFRYFSRRGFDYTASYGPNKYEGLFTPSIAECFGLNVDSCILDGEMVGWHQPTQSFGHKGLFFDVKHILEGSEYTPCYCAFDLLYLNGCVLTSQPLSRRKELLQTKFKPLPTRFVIVPFWKAKSEAEVLVSLSQAIEAHEEGLMLKDSSSIYTPNGRTNAGWFKLKPYYVHGLLDSLDLIILGGYYKQPRQTKSKHRNRSAEPLISDPHSVVSHLVCGVRIIDYDGKDGNYSSNDFLPICVVGSGYANSDFYENLVQITTSNKICSISHYMSSLNIPTNKNNDKYETHAKNLINNHTSRPNKVLWNLRRYQPHFVIKDPWYHSHVVQIKAANISLRSMNDYSTNRKLNKGRKSKIKEKNMNTSDDDNKANLLLQDSQEEALILDENRPALNDLIKGKNKDSREKMHEKTDATQNLMNDPYLRFEPSQELISEITDSSVIAIDDMVENADELDQLDEKNISQLTPNNTYIRFKYPKLERYRVDKDWQDAMTFQDIIELGQQSMQDKAKAMANTLKQSNTNNKATSSTSPAKSLKYIPYRLYKHHNMPDSKKSINIYKPYEDAKHNLRSSLTINNDSEEENLIDNDSFDELEKRNSQSYDLNAEGNNDLQVGLDVFTPNSFNHKKNENNGGFNDFHKPDGAKHSGRKRKRSLIQSAKPLLYNASSNASNLHIIQKSDIFEGKEFYIVTGDEDSSKAQIEKLCLENGAAITQSPGPRTTCVIAGKMNVKVNNFIAAHTHNVIKTDWIHKCLKAGKYIEWESCDILGTSFIEESPIEEKICKELKHKSPKGDISDAITTQKLHKNDDFVSMLDDMEDSIRTKYKEIKSRRKKRK